MRRDMAFVLSVAILSYSATISSRNFTQYKVTLQTIHMPVDSWSLSRMRHAGPSKFGCQLGLESVRSHSSSCASFEVLLLDQSGPESRIGNMGMRGSSFFIPQPSAVVLLLGACILGSCCFYIHISLVGPKSHADPELGKRDFRWRKGKNNKDW